MTIAAAISLRKAIHNALAADAGLGALLGGPAIFDEAPREARAPYVTFGDLQSRDWSTSSDEGMEHLVAVNVWSSQRGTREAIAIADSLRALLHDQPLPLDSHHLVSLRFIQFETRRESNGRFARASLRFRAVTEPL